MTHLFASKAVSEDSGRKEVVSDHPRACAKLFAFASNGKRLLVIPPVPQPQNKIPSPRGRWRNTATFCAADKAVWRIWCELMHFSRL